MFWTFFVSDFDKVRKYLEVHSYRVNLFHRFLKIILKFRESFDRWLFIYLFFQKSLLNIVKN